MAYIQDWGMRVQAQPQINTTRRAFLHLSQNENGRMLNIRITDVNIPSGSTAVLAGTKPDGTVYSQAGTLAGNTATFAEDVQMTAVAGTWDAKITITNGGNCICTARITITIDPDTVAGGAIPSDSQLDGIIAECRAIADSVRKEAYGSPLVADAVEDMTDQSRVYVYTGSESGMTAGHWYYYNGTVWSDGGIYNAVAVDTDTTLSIAGKAADAKKVGDADDAINAVLATKADTDGAIASAEQLLSDKYTIDQVPYTFRASGGDGADREYDEIVGGSIVWNQLCNGSSVTVLNGHKYYMVKGGTASVGASTGAAITGLTSGTDMVSDLTQMFGTTIADYIYSLEQTTAGAGVAWFKKLFPKDYYAYNAGTMTHVSGLSSHDTVGFNAYNPTARTAKVVGGQQYQITGTYTGLTLDGETVTPDASGYFTPDASGTLTVTGGNSTDTCVHLAWDGERDGEYEPYVRHSYPLDDSLTLRGISKLDSNNQLYYDGDTYAADGTVTRKYGIVDLGTLSWTHEADSKQFYSNIFASGYSGWMYNVFCSKYIQDHRTYTVVAAPHVRGINNNRIYIIDDSYTDAASFKAAMSGVMLVYELATPTMETATPFTNPQICDPSGTEEYTTTSIVPVGHYTKYPANLRSAIERVMEQVPEAPSANGTYTLKATKTSSGVTYAWVAE